MDHNVLHYDWNWQLPATPEELWPLISDTNRLNQDLNLPSLRKADLSYDFRDGFLQLSYNSIQNSDAWEEEPYQWERPYQFGVKRYYKNGSCREIKIQADLYPNDRGTRIRYQIWATPRNYIHLLTTPIRLNLFYRRKLKSVLKNYGQLVSQHKQPYQTERNKRLVRGGRERMKDFRIELSMATGEHDIISKLIDYLLRARDIDVKKMEPYLMADQWNECRQKTLNVFLHAAKIGLLNFNWIIHCPDCRTVQQTCKTLSDVHEPILCENCREEHNVDFNRTLQLSFCPNPLVRKVSDSEYCLSGPQVTPHVAVKQLLETGQRRFLKTKLEEGTYLLRVQGLKGEARVRVSREGKENITVILDRYGLNGENVEISPEPNLVLYNLTEKQRIFTLEKATWCSDVVTAAQVTSLQLFRELFDKEVLRKGEKVTVSEQTLMFTDLFDSTGMYNQEGDAKAVGRVIEHFEILQEAVSEENGAIVKTIGDSVMAVFNNPAQAFKAFTRAHKIISKDYRFNGRLKLKAGIHHGSCVAVNLNNKIDYFGSTVNIASRLADFADEDEVVLSQSVARHHEVSELMDVSAYNYLSKDVMANLRGFEGERFLIKRIAMDKPPLRLVI